MSSQRREVPHAPKNGEPQRRIRPYRRPELKEYGSLTELTRGGPINLPNDVGNSFSI